VASVVKTHFRFANSKGRDWPRRAPRTRSWRKPCDGEEWAKFRL